MAAAQLLLKYAGQPAEMATQTRKNAIQFRILIWGLRRLKPFVQETRVPVLSLARFLQQNLAALEKPKRRGSSLPTSAIARKKTYACILDPIWFVFPREKPLFCIEGKPRGKRLQNTPSSRPYPVRGHTTSNRIMRSD